MAKLHVAARKLTCYLLFIICLSSLAACTLETEGVAVHDPVREAQATRVTLAAQDESARRAVERQILQARAEAARHALPAVALRDTLISTGLGAGVVVLAVGSAFAAVAWLNKRATAVYPNNAGLYPVIVKRGWNGATIVHDPNRALGPTTIYGPLQPSGLPAVHFSAPAGESALLQVATQAQAIGLMAAATRNGEGQSRQAAQLAQSLIGRPALSAPLPPVRVSTLDLAQVERLLEAAGED